jgi:hypothetical protein
VGAGLLLRTVVEVNNSWLVAQVRAGGEGNGCVGPGLLLLTCGSSQQQLAGTTRWWEGAVNECVCVWGGGVLYARLRGCVSISSASQVFTPATPVR